MFKNIIISKKIIITHKFIKYIKTIQRYYFKKSNILFNLKRSLIKNIRTI